MRLSREKPDDVAAATAIVIGVVVVAGIVRISGVIVGTPSPVTQAEADGGRGTRESLMVLAKSVLEAAVERGGCEAVA